MTQGTTTTLICSGYTTAGYLAIGNDVFNKISLISYSASFLNKPIQSQGMAGFATSVNNINRTRGAFILDVPEISCDIEFEVELSLLVDIVNTLKNSRNTFFKVKIRDEASGIEWLFDECYIASFSFSVQKDSILSVNMSFFVQPNTISYSSGNREVLAIGTDRTIPIRQPIPYYSWRILGAEELPDVLEFSFSFSQQIIPKYECGGGDTMLAPVAEKLLFELPVMEFEYTQLLVKSQQINIQSSSTTFHINEEELNEDDFIINVMGSDLFRLTGLELIEYTPELLGTPSVKKKYSVNGMIK